MRTAGEDHQPRADILLHRLADNLVLPLEMIDTVLFMGKLSTTLGTHKSVFFATLVLEVSVEVIIPVVSALK